MKTDISPWHIRTVTDDLEMVTQKAQVIGWSWSAEDSDSIGNGSFKICVQSCSSHSLSRRLVRGAGWESRLLLPDSRTRTPEEPLYWLPKRSPGTILCGVLRACDDHDWMKRWIICGLIPAFRFPPSPRKTANRRAAGSGNRDSRAGRSFPSCATRRNGWHDRHR